MKKPVPASWLFRDQNRQKIISDHFEGESAKGSMISQKAKEIWSSMSDEEKQPYITQTEEKWVLYREANPSSTPTTPKKDFNFTDKYPDTLPEKWEGPFEKKYLHKYAKGYKVGVGRFETFEEAIVAAEQTENCGGITMSTGKRPGFTLRVSNDPVTDTESDPMGPFVSWIKKDYTPITTPRKKKTSKKVPENNTESEPQDKPKEVDQSEGENNSDDEMPFQEKPSNSNESTYNDETEDESEDSDDSDGDDDDADDLEVIQWDFKGRSYLIDEKTNELFDFDTQEPIGKIRKTKKDGGYKLKDKTSK